MAEGFNWKGLTTSPDINAKSCVSWVTPKEGGKAEYRIKTTNEHGHVVGINDVQVHDPDRLLKDKIGKPGWEVCDGVDPKEILKKLDQ